MHLISLRRQCCGALLSRQELVVEGRRARERGDEHPQAARGPSEARRPPRGVGDPDPPEGPGPGDRRGGRGWL